MDEIVIRFSVKDDGMPQIERLNKTLGKTKDASSALLPGLESARTKMTGFVSANAGAIAILVGVGAAIGKTISSLVAYGDQVQKLKTITGQSAEETSRQIQLADDMRISYDQLTIALQFASKKGVDTSIAGLGTLSDQYKNLAPGIEQTKFLTDTFGKSGVEMGKILEMDAQKMKELAASTPKGLLLDEQDLLNIKIYNQQLDEVQDNVKAIGQDFAKWAIGTITGTTAEIEKLARANYNAATGGKYLTDQIFGLNDVQEEAWQVAMKQAEAEFAAAHGIEAVGDAAEGTGPSVEDLVDPLEAAQKAAKDFSDSLVGLLSSMFAIQDENEQLYKDMEDVAKTEKDLEQQRAEALGDLLKSKDKQSQKEIDLREKIDETTDADKRRKLIQDGLRDATEANNDATAEYLKKIQEIDEKTIEAAAKRKELAEQDTENSKKRVYDLAQQRLAADGLIDAGEYEYLQDLAVAKGLVTQAAADQAIAESQEADALIANFNKTNPVMQTTLDTMQNIAALHGTVVDYQVNFRVAEDGSLVSDQFYGSGGYSPYALPAGAGGSSNKKRDSGGSGIAGMAYEIGTGAQPETFVPDTNGQFYPKGKGLGNTTIINITNPKREVAENSIRKALKSLSYLGVAS